jgi:predicted enzyme related to lactoylglutathione lyase
VGSFDQPELLAPPLHYWDSARLPWVQFADNFAACRISVFRTVNFIMNNDARNNRIDYIEFPVSSAEALAQTKRFYGKVFGWEYKDWGPAYADTHNSGVTSGIAVDEVDRQHRPLAVIFSKDLENSRAGVVAAGATLTKDIFAFPGGRRFQFRDPAGNELAVWSDQ